MLWYAPLPTPGVGKLMPSLTVFRKLTRYDVFFAASLPLVLLAVAGGLWAIPQRGTPWLVLLDVGLAWFSALATLVLVPIDVASALQVITMKIISLVSELSPFPKALPLPDFALHSSGAWPMLTGTELRT